MMTQGASGATASTAEEIQAWLTSHLANVQGIDPRSIDVRERFSRYGLDSQRATGLLAQLAGWLGRPLPPTLMWEYPTIQALARHLSEGAREAPAREGERRQRPPLSEPIAIVGMACRFPQAPSVEAYWRLLCDGVDAVSEVPARRWNVEALYDPDRGAPGKMSTRWGGFLDQVDLFDAQFFGISPREAAQMDPQQRLMLELSWEALEDAGIPPHGLRGSATAVFFGALWSDYARLPGNTIEAITPHTATGQDLSIIPARVSYTLGLQGPSIAVDTACSSSLVAVHLACQSLRSGESTLALAGGVNLILAPESTVMMSKFGAMAPDGRSKAFDARANGYVRGEGAGVVVLKPLSRALLDGDPIACVILASAANNDGLSNGLTAPNPKAQEAVLREAYVRAGVSPSRVHYVETHGTGTLLGDPIEAGALGAVLGAGRPTDRPLRLGSVKTNIGHLEAAAGIAGLIKAALAIEHRTLPGNLHFQRPNPHIPFEDLRLSVQQRVEPWPDDDRALAGVSSFGFGGTNCHVVLADARPAPVCLLPMAADSEEALRSTARRIGALATAPDVRPPLAELCSSAAARLGPGNHRLALAARSYGDLATQIESFLAGHPRPGMSSGDVSGRRPRLVFMFAGQGSQWLGMGRDLLRDEPAFRAALERCQAAMRPYLDWSLLELLTTDDARLVERSDVAQPAIFALQVALAALWQSWGVEPDAVVGQSMGEVAAAHVAGALSLDDAARIICRRSQIVSRLSGQGGMAVVDLPLEDTERALRGYEGRLSVAVSSSPRSTVVSGEVAALAEVAANLQRQGVFCQHIKVDYASHSAYMDPLRAELREALDGIRPRAAGVPFYSTVTGGVLGGAELDAAYWVRNLREPVLFARASELLLDHGVDLFLDVDPHPLLKHSVEQSLAFFRREGVVLPSLRRGEDGRAVLLDSLGLLYTRGRAVLWHRICPPPLTPSSPPDAPWTSALTPEPGSPAEDAERDASPELCVLSAHSPEALRELTRGVAAWIRERGDIDLRDLCHTASARRSHHEHRFAAVGRSREEMATALDAQQWAEGQGAASSGAPPRVVFVFPGQGSQWLGMGRRLLATEPVFRAAIEACEQALTPHVTWRLTAELGADEASSRLGEIDVVQPVLWAIQLALAALWRSWGIEPAAVVGHSLGEVAAAQVAGALSIEDAARVISLRSQAVRRHASGKGAMAVVELSFEEAERAIAGHLGRLAVGVSNGPRSSVLSGDPAALAQVLDALRERDVFCRPIKVDYASHSPQMDALKPLLLDALSPIAPRPGRVPFYSTVTAGWLGGERLDAAYWAANLREPVRFARAVRELGEAGHDVFLEISPHPVLVAAMDDALRDLGRGGVALGSLRRDEDERASLLGALGALYTRGASPDFAKLHPDGGRVVPLPAYPWQRERYWLDPEPARSPSSPIARAQASGEHPLLGAPFTTPAHPGTHVWEQSLGPEAAPYLSDHRVLGAVVLPAAAYVEMALAAAGQAYGAGPHELEAWSFREALVFSEGLARRIQVVVSEQGPAATAPQAAPATGARAARLLSFQLFSRVDREVPSAGAWTLHASGTILLNAEHAMQTAREAPEAIQQRAALEIAGGDHYAALAALGLTYGPSFQGVRRTWLGRDEAISQVSLPEGLSADPYTLHPALLDACFQTALSSLASPGAREPLGRSHGSPFVPVRLRNLRVHGRPAGDVWSHVRMRQGEGGGIIESDVTLLDATGRVLVEVLGLAMQRLEGSPPRKHEEPGDDSLLALEWRRADAPRREAGKARDERGRWLLLADEGGLAAEVQSQLARRGERALLALPAGAARPHGGDHVAFDPSSPEAFDTLLRGAFADGAPCRGVVHLSSLDAAAAEESMAPEALETAALEGCVSAIGLVQALARAGFRDAPKLWLVTRGAQAVGADRAARVAVAQAPLWGLGQTLLYEHPELRCARVDLGGFAGEAEALVEELCSPSGEAQVALRPDGRHVARLVRRAAGAGAELTVVPEGTYLITGGLGGLGLSLGRWLVERGARHLVLVGRRGAADRAQIDAVAALEAASARVMVAQADVSDRADLARVLRDARARMPPLRGVIHAAGVLEDGLVTQQSRERFRRAMAPKVRGAWNLHALTEGTPLDFFVLYSSAASLVGSPGQSNYAAANAFLDALAHLRRARGLPALSINWGPFSGVGLAAAEERRGARLAERGMASLTVEQGHALLGQLLGSGATQIGAVPLDPSRWIESYPGIASSSLFSELVQPGARSHDASGEIPRLRRAVMTAAPAERLRRLEQIVEEQAIKVLRIAPSRIRRTTNLLNLGVDSLLGLELRNRLEIELGLKLPSTLFWTYPRVDALARHLLDLLGLPQTSADEAREPEPPAHPPPAPVRPAPAAPSAASIEAPPAPPGQQLIAIIGVSGRYPMAPDLDAFWRNLCEGRSCLEEVPRSRWDADSFARTQGDPDAQERGGGRWGGFLEDIESFDPALFHLSPREALSMDPAERLALETAWRTFEDAGQGRGGKDRPGLERRVGVFIGCMYNHYPWLADEALRQGTLFNNSYFAIANRISHFFDLRGPSLAIDTACSSSLVAIHMACESLRAGGCAMALAGGVNLTLHPYKYLALRQYNMLGSGAVSRSLGHGDGMVPGEGVGMVLLKPLAAALRDGDRIEAVVRGGAVNHNGRGMGYTAPSPDAQAELLREALAQAGLTPDRLSYLELAANGSPLGDEAEIMALAQVFGSSGATRPISIGTVKSNIGHLEAASGVSQLTKVLLQLRHRNLVPSINADPPNPRLGLEQTPFRIQQSLSAWEAPEGEPRRALITSLGGGGANACLVVEEHRAEAPSPPAEEAPRLFVFSAPDAARLAALLESFEHYLADARPDLRDLAFTLLTGRAALDARIAFTARSLEELRDRLAAARRGDDDPDVFRGEVGPGARPLRLFEEDEDLRETVASWIRKGRLQRLAELWVNGIDIDWRLLPRAAQGRPIPLPGVPFARVRLWPEHRQELVNGHIASARPDALGAAGAPSPRAADADRSVPDPRSADTVLDQVRAAVAELLHLPGPEAVHPDQELRRYGFDSLSGLRLLNRMQPDAASVADRRAFLELRTARAWASRLAGAAAAPPADLRAVLEALAAGRMTPDEALAHGSADAPERPNDPPAGER